MPSSRWLKPVANPKESAEQSEPTPNVSMRDVRRLAREKAARQDDEANEALKPTATVDTPVITTVDTTVDTPAITTATDITKPHRLTTVDTPVTATVTTPAITPVGTPVIPTSETRQLSEPEDKHQNSAYVDLPVSSEGQIRGVQSQYLDATHTASEQRVYSVMYRETISKGVRERHYGPKELCTKTGIRSDRTVRMAVRGLVQKLSIEIVSHGAYFPQGPRYRVIEPKEVLRRRRVAGMEIDPQTKKITTPVATTVATTAPVPLPAPARTGVGGGGENYSSTTVEVTGVTPVEITGVYKEENDIGGREVYSSTSSSNAVRKNDDDEAFANFLSAVKKTAKEITGKEPSPAEAARWGEVAEVLMTELRIAAGRTTVSSVPSFLAEHLRRRLWKKEKQQIESEAAEQKTSTNTTEINPADCPDCFGTGMYYPGGFEKGVARCRHDQLRPDAEANR
jgi:hypothetical protein